ncbi:MAG: hypothetical protein ACE5H4_14665 [Candidatus Thorarchaeota archaeon]
MGLEFKHKAIVLSGVAGTRLKTKVLGRYYRFWHSVQSGGKRGSYRYPTSIIDLNAGTGLLYINEEREIIYGSAGHALELKYKSIDIGTKNLSVFLVEEHDKCREYLLENIEEEWDVKLQQQKGISYPVWTNGAVWLFESVKDFLEFTESGSMIDRGLFLFDPLLAPEYAVIERVAKSRISIPFQRGTEFILFFFTSDWVNGRKGFSPLPRDADESKWKKGETGSAQIADVAFGNRAWLRVMEMNGSSDVLQDSLLLAYEMKLRKWFRLVLPIPFQPKKGQTYHILCCSNYEVGINLIRSEWEHLVGIHKGERVRSGVIDLAKDVFPRFSAEYPGIMLSRKKGQKRPSEWRVLWKVAREFADGTCDQNCKSLIDIAGSSAEVERCLEWSESEGFLTRETKIPWAWAKHPQFPRFRANYNRLNEVLGISLPLPMRPLTADALAFQKGEQDTEFLSPRIDGLEIDVRFRCPKCNDLVVSDGAITILPPYFAADSDAKSIREDWETLWCQNRDCEEEYSLHWVHSMYTGLYFRIEDTKKDHPFWYRELSLYEDEEP